jgi:hypothetical protein
MTGAVIEMFVLFLFFPKMYPASIRKDRLPASSKELSTAVYATMIES